MKLEVNVKKKYVAFLLSGILLLAAAIGTYAYVASSGAVPNPGHLLTEIQGYFQSDANLQASLGKFCQADGTNCQGGSVVQVAQAFRKDGPEDTGSSAVNRPIVVLQGSASAFIPLNNVNASSSSSYFTSPSKNKLDGLKCNEAQGWKLTGCWEIVTDSDSDVYPYLNGCVTNDFDQYSGVELSISCVK